jgi:hypothetical protein
MPEDNDTLAKLTKLMEEGAEDLHMAPGLGVNDFDGKYPITVNAIGLGKIGAGDPLCAKIGDWVAVRPCAEECEGKTYLGVMIGDLPISPMVRYRPTTGELLFAMRDNPAIWVPDLNRIVWGMESWWGVIKDPDHLRKITNEDIENVWYVQALKALSATDQTEATCEHCGAPCEYDTELCLCERCKTEANDGKEDQRDQGVEQQ